MALKMTFYPLEFKGLFRPIGWQGIIPAKASEMAGKAVDLITSKLLDIEEVFSRLEPEKIAIEVEPTLVKISEEIIDEIMQEEAALLWEAAPKTLKMQIYSKFQKNLPQMITEMMQEAETQISEIFDVKQMVIEELETDKKLLIEIFLRCGKKEFPFIEKSGFYFGFIFGIFQALMMYFAGFLNVSIYLEAAILPFVGLFVGWATNVIALKMIFEPAEPKKYLGLFTFQGFFIKRQKEVSKDYAQIIASKILTPENIFERIITGPKSDQVVKITQKYVHRSIDNTTGIAKPFLIFLTGKKYIQIKEKVCNEIIKELPILVRPTFDYAKEALNIEASLEEKMKNLSPPEFEEFLRPVFQKDEWKLIAMGAFLGFLAGFYQLMFMFPEVWLRFLK